MASAFAFEGRLGHGREFQSTTERFRPSDTRNENKIDQCQEITNYRKRPFTCQILDWFYSIKEIPSMLSPGRLTRADAANDNRFHSNDIASPVSFKQENAEQQALINSARVAFIAGSHPLRQRAAHGHQAKGTLPPLQSL